MTLLFSLTISIREDRVLFLLIHLTGVSCFHSSSLILSSFPSFLNWRAVWNPSYPLCHSFNSSGGSVLLISSSNIPSSQVHVLFLPCSTGVLPEFFPSHLVLTGVVSNSILPLNSWFMSLQPSSSCNVPCSSLLTECLQSRSSLLYSFFYIAQPLKVRGFTRLSKKQFSLPLLFLFLFPPVPS